MPHGSVLDLLGNILVDEPVHKAAFKQVLLDYLGNVLFLDVAVEGALGVDDDNGAERAKAEAAGLDYLYLVLEALLLKLLFKGGHEHLAAR